MSKTKTTPPPSRLPNGKHNPAYRKFWAKNNPLKQREINRKKAEQYRKTEKWKSYFRDYQREYYKKNKAVHAIRVSVSHLKGAIRNNRKLGYEYSVIRNMLESIGWSCETDMHINHKVPLALMVKVNPNLSRITAFDTMNIELVAKQVNHKAEKRLITEETYKLAIEMENAHKEELKGLAKEVKKHIGSML